MKYGVKDVKPRPSGEWRQASAKHHNPEGPESPGIMRMAKQPYGEATPYYGVQAVWAETRLRCPKRAIGVNDPSGNTFFQAPSRGTHKTVVESL